LVSDESAQCGVEPDEIGASLWSAARRADFSDVGQLGGVARMDSAEGARWRHCRPSP